MSDNHSRPVHVFVSYRHADHRVVDKLREYLGWLENSDSITVFDDRQIVAGDDWDMLIRRELNRADIIVLVVSAAFMQSPYCTRMELKEALRLRSDKGVRVVPIIAETCDWEVMPLRSIAALPKDLANNLKPLNKWGRDRDVALTQIAQQVRQNVERVRSGKLQGQSQPDPDETPPSTPIVSSKSSEPAGEPGIPPGLAALLVKQVYPMLRTNNWLGRYVKTLAEATCVSEELMLDFCKSRNDIGLFKDGSRWVAALSERLKSRVPL